MIEAGVAGCAYFVFVFFKAFQQRNVAFMHYRWVIPLSYLMSASEVLVIYVVARGAMSNDWLQMLPMVAGIGTGGGLGALASMWLHHKYIGENDVHS